jgi:Asp-tRNA(Asn)/Glu-tRNA(Gln) amidotransferase A subunit family amidase
VNLSSKKSGASGEWATFTLPINLTWTATAPTGDPFGAAGSLLGLPAIAFPGPMPESTPTGSVLIGCPWSEARLVDCLRRFQQQTDWHKPLPPGA